MVFALINAEQKTTVYKVAFSRHRGYGYSLTAYLWSLEIKKKKVQLGTGTVI